jgi:formylglycine-generating enzyme required for sulfatase activity
MSTNEEKYSDKLQELLEMLKFSIYSTEEIIQKMRNMQTFAKFHQLEVDDFNEDDILNIAQELQPFYDGLWEAKLVKDWKEKYQKLSLTTRKIYHQDEVKRDWQARQYSKGKYDEMMAYLDKEVHWLDELEARFKRYHEEQIYYADRKEFFLIWDEIVAKYQDQILKRDTHQIGEVEFNMVYCPAGEFWMGNNIWGIDWESCNPKHQVKMNKRFWMGETQVNQELWQAVMGWKPSGCKGGSKLPIEKITWYDSLVFCNKLSELEKFTPCFNLTNIEKDGNSITKANVEWLRNANGYRLPTEAEWEYSVKAYSLLIDNGSNAWGLYDIGNAWEWCMDQWDSNAYKSRSDGIENPILWSNSPCVRVVRGNSCRYDRYDYRVTERFSNAADDQSSLQSFRLLRCEP